MAILPMTRNAPPPRIYPNMNAIDGIRLTYNSGEPGAPGPFLKLNVPIPIGTAPAQAFVTGFDWHIRVASTGAATLSVGTLAQPTRFMNAEPLNAAAQDSADAATAYGYLSDDVEVIYALLQGSADLSNAVFTALLTYYAHSD